MTLKDIKIGESANVLNVGGDGALRQHFLDMGVIPGAKITVVKYAPMGDPVELMIHGYELTLRLDDAAKIDVEPVSFTEEEKKPTPKKKSAAHPGLGEAGKSHPEVNTTPLDDSTQLTFALVGNQNCGKTTLFSVNGNTRKVSYVLVGSG